MVDIDGQLVGGLMVLAAIADANSFGRAAERLGMTQSGVSKAIAKLEARLGARLVHRTSRAVELTDEGRALYERVAGHLAGISEAAAATAKSRDAVRGRLRVNVDPLFSRMVLAPKLAAFLLQNPQLELRIETRDRIADLVSDGFDLAVRFGEPAPSALIARRLFTRGFSRLRRRPTSNSTGGRATRRISRTTRINVSWRSTQRLGVRSIGSSGAIANAFALPSTAGSPSPTPAPSSAPAWRGSGWHR
jgi:DNA-binding transcriptional LysR family regulator